MTTEILRSDIQRTGLSLVFSPAAGQETIADVVFVHSLFGHPYDTWTSPKPQEIFWPRVLLAKALPQVRILTFGYDVDILKVFGSTGQASVYQHAKDLLNDICEWRTTVEEKKRPIIFIAHSLGGIVVKDALAQSDAAVTYIQEVIPAVRGVCFLGTPHRGSGAASLGKIAAELSKYFFKKPNTQVLQTLEVNSSELEKTGTLFNQLVASTVFFLASTFCLQLKSDTEKDTCLDSLDISQTRDRLRMVEKTFGDTYEWIFDDGLGFKNWLSSATGSPTFWIEGKAGSGKSTIMKYVLRNPKTKEFLKRCDPAPWTLASFFFHDRGSDLQKTIDGLLCAILHDILKTLSSIHSKDSEQLHWSSSELKEALVAILDQKETHVNLCLFIDGLDEQVADRQGLIQLLRDIEQKSSVRIKLCLASRPESEFLRVFEKKPQFRMHEHTFEDIRKYCSERLAQESGHNLQAEGAGEWQDLVNEITHKARGVFLWVRLVLDELLENLVIHGDSISSLRRELFGIPSELNDLYQRALTRKIGQLNNSRLQSARRHKFETFVMFQAALCARRAFTLPYFLGAVSLIVSDLEEDFDYDEMRQPIVTRNMRLRLASRCGGLLEAVTGTAFHRTGDRDTVQFIHQTAKEFMIERTTTHERLDEQLNVENLNGHVLLLRYCLKVVSRDLPIQVPDLLFHAFRASLEVPSSLVAELNSFLQDDNENKERVQRLYNNLDLDDSFKRLRKHVESPVVQMLLIAIFGNLFPYIKHSLTQPILRIHGPRLLSAAACIAAAGSEDTELDPTIMDHMLGMGMSANTEFEHFTPLQIILRHLNFERFLSTSYLSVLKVIDTLLQRGADANAAHDLQRQSGSVLRARNRRTPLDIVFHRFREDLWRLDGNVPPQPRFQLIVRGSQVVSAERLLLELLELFVRHGMVIHEYLLINSVNLQARSVVRRILEHGVTQPGISFRSETILTKSSLPPEMLESWKDLFDEYTGAAQMTPYH